MQSKNGCPFCRLKVVAVTNSSPPDLGGFQVQCDNCDARGPIYKDQQDAIEGWELGIYDQGKSLRAGLPTDEGNK